MIQVAAGFNIIEHHEEYRYGSQLLDKVEQFKYEKGRRDFSVGDQEYLLVALGERPTAGFNISIDKVIELSDRLEVYLQEELPGAISAHIQVITYPYLLAQIEQPVVVYFNNDIFD